MAMARRLRHRGGHARAARRHAPGHVVAAAAARHAAHRRGVLGQVAAALIVRPAARRGRRVLPRRQLIRAALLREQRLLLLHGPSL